MTKFVPRIAIAGLILLAIATAFILLGRNDLTTNPSATNYQPPGASLYAELLRREGLKVRIDGDYRVRAKPDDVLIVFDRGEELREDLLKSLERHLESGGKILRGSMPKSYYESAKLAKVGEIESLYGKDRLEIHGAQDGAAPMRWENGWKTIYVATAAGGIVAEAGSKGKGYGISVNDAIGVTNRFIDQAENARFYVGLAKALAGAEGSVVFVDAAAGQGRDIGLLETIGNWLRYSWYQVLLLFFVIVYTLGKPFGQGILDRPKQGGQRDLVDAMAGVYRRGRAGQAALMAISKDADRQFRSMSKTALDAPASVRDERLEPEVAELLRKAESMAMVDRLDEKLAFPLAQRLRQEIAVRRRPTVSRRRKRH